MATVAPRVGPKFRSLAEVLARVGDVPADRVLTYPAPGTATEADLLDNTITGGRLCELVEGILVEKPMGVREDYLGTWLIYLFQQFVIPSQLGAVLGPQSLIRFRPSVVRLPDVAVILWDSLDDPDDVEDPDGAFLDVAPDFIVEVLSPSNTKKEMGFKLKQYAEAGVRIVWYVDPDRKEATVYPKGRERGKKVVGLGGVLDGGDVLPGFTLPVAKIFEKRGPARKGKKGGKR
jgi:Uma2 family endonuclease